MENAVNKQQLTDEIYKRNFALLAPVTHLNDQSMTDFMEVINFTSGNKTKPTVAEFISDNIEQINTQLKTRGAVLIRGATDCNDSFGAIPKSISEYRQSQQKDQSKPDQKERIRIGESNSDFSIRKLILEDYFPRDPKQLDGFSVIPQAPSPPAPLSQCTMKARHFQPIYYLCLRSCASIAQRLPIEVKALPYWRKTAM
jgi:hypothetical protein